MGPSKGFGDRLRQERQRQKLSQIDLAKAAGVEQSTISKWERSGLGAGGANLEALCSLAHLLGVHLEWLACGTGPRERGTSADACHERAVALAFAEADGIDAGVIESVRGWPMTSAAGFTPSQWLQIVRAQQAARSK